ncbi:MAG TPA: response regulator transcription factor [Ktedonobacteraceae bacterium]|nr:response regulator transcription factor [Ktedonobacteraceae bacterium]
MKDEAFFNGLVIEKFQIVRCAIQQAMSALACIRSVVAIEEISAVARIVKNALIDVVILGPSTSLHECLEVTKFVKMHHSCVRVVTLTRLAAPEIAQTLARSGIDSILDETATEQDLLNAIQACSSGHIFYSQTVHKKIVFPSKKSDRLTPCEMQVLSLILEGGTNHFIAQSMCITSKTVEAHITRIYRKLDVSSRAQAILRAQDLYPALGRTQRDTASSLLATTVGM